MTKVSIPAKVDGLFRLAELIHAKHTELGDASPLNMLDWAVAKTNLDAAVAKHQIFEDLHRQAETIREERDLMAGQIREIVRQSRDILKGVHRKDMHKLGEYGFEVNN